MPKVTRLRGWTNRGSIPDTGKKLFSPPKRLGSGTHPAPSLMAKDNSLPEVKTQLA